MDSYIKNQITLLGVVVIVFAIVIFFFTKQNKSEKFGCFFTLVIFIGILALPRVIGFKYFSSEVVGTTTGVTSGLKSPGMTINFTFVYNGKHYKGGNSYNHSVNTHGGRYKVIVSDFIYVSGWMDFSQPIE
jgi:hypothetical protein